MNRGNFSIFIPQQGCPYHCIYCDQHKISGEAEMAPEKAERILEREIPRWVERKKQGQIAFFGGTFTGLPMDQMVAYLKAAEPYVQSGAVDGIRISTRPDCIDKERLDVLSHYGVKYIELGVQSLDDEVLAASHRGYVFSDVERSAELILSSGFVLGMQMMPGLPLDTDEKSMLTAQKIIEFGATETRIYPTLVIRNTPLAKWYENGKYQPMTLEHAVELSADLRCLFEQNNVTVLKVGLHSGAIEQDILAGPFHPAFGQLVNSKMCLQKLVSYCEKKDLRNAELYVRPDRYDVSDIVGQNRSNVQYLEKNFGIFLKISKKELTNRELSIIL